MAESAWGVGNLGLQRLPAVRLAYPGLRRRAGQLGQRQADDVSGAQPWTMLFIEGPLKGPGGAWQSEAVLTSPGAGPAGRCGAAGPARFG